MNIGSQIKKRRNELSLTQKDLAEKLNVSRSAVSNWELERNYPDIQTIVNLSDALDIPLDTLLKGDAVVIKKLTEDTRGRKKSRKIIILLIILLAFISGYCFYLANKNQSLDSKGQISKFDVTNQEVQIKLNFPKYRTLETWWISNSEKDSDTLEVTIDSKLDFSMENNKEINIPIDFNSKEYKQYKYIKIISSEKNHKKKTLAVRNIPR